MGSLCRWSIKQYLTIRDLWSSQTLAKFVVRLATFLEYTKLLNRSYVQRQIVCILGEVPLSDPVNQLVCGAKDIPEGSRISDRILVLYRKYKIEGPSYHEIGERHIHLSNARRLRLQQDHGRRGSSIPLDKRRDVSLQYFLCLRGGKRNSFQQGYEDRSVRLAHSSGEYWRSVTGVIRTTSDIVASDQLFLQPVYAPVRKLRFGTSREVFFIPWPGKAFGTKP